MDTKYVSINYFSFFRIKIKKENKICKNFVSVYNVNYSLYKINRKLCFVLVICEHLVVDKIKKKNKFTQK